MTLQFKLRLSVIYKFTFSVI